MSVGNVVGVPVGNVVGSPVGNSWKRGRNRGRECRGKSRRVTSRERGWVHRGTHTVPRRLPASRGCSVLRKAAPPWVVCARRVIREDSRHRAGGIEGGWGAYRWMPGWFRGLVAGGDTVRCRAAGPRRCCISWEGAGSGKRKRTRAPKLAKSALAAQGHPRSPWPCVSPRSSAGSRRCSVGVYIYHLAAARIVGV